MDLKEERKLNRRRKEEKGENMRKQMERTVNPILGLFLSLINERSRTH